MRTIDADYLINTINDVRGGASQGEYLGMLGEAVCNWAIALVNQCPTIPAGIPNRENFTAILDAFLPCVKDEVKNDIIDRVLLETHTTYYWIDHSNDDESLPWYMAYECPVCHRYSSGMSHCPFCGAKNVRKEKEDEHMDDQ